MNDPTESFRRKEVADINSQVESPDKNAERTRLEKQYGEVWDTDELSAKFIVSGFMAPYASVRRILDGKKGIVKFQHMPRFYFNFCEI